MVHDRDRRARVLASTSALALLWTLAEAVWLPTDGPTDWLREPATFVLRWGVVLLAASLLAKLRHAWHRSWRRRLVELFDRMWHWSVGAPGPRAEPVRSALGLGDRIALACGLPIVALDVLLTTLLLRDVFPTPPYRIPWLDDALGGGGWGFFGCVAALKAGLALWFGAFERSRSEASDALRWFVLGSAATFDVALAIARGYVLAQQDLTGAPIMVSNIVFVGFGAAVPWVVAHTGRLLATALDPWLSRYTLLGLVFSLPRFVGLALLWGTTAVVVVPLGIVGLAVGGITAVWFAIEDIVALVLGQDPPGPPLDARIDSEARPPSASGTIEVTLSPRSECRA